MWMGKKDTEARGQRKLLLLIAASRKLTPRSACTSVPVRVDCDIIALRARGELTNGSKLFCFGASAKKRAGDQKNRTELIGCMTLAFACLWLVMHQPVWT